MAIVEVKDSGIVQDLVEFPDLDLGLGLYQRIRGRIIVDFRGDFNVCILRKDMTPEQSHYAVQSSHDEDYVIVPSIEALEIGEVDWAFRANQDKVNPTHILDYVETYRDYPHTYPYLRPLRVLEPDTEITFDYNLKNTK